MSDFVGVRIERRDTVGVVTISNPARRNAFTPDLRRELTARLQELVVDPDIRAIVCSGRQVEDSEGLGISAIFAKPVDVDELADAIHSAMLADAS